MLGAAEEEALRRRLAELSRDELRRLFYDDFKYRQERSLFSLPFKYTIDHPFTWMFFVYMLMFMIFVDTSQRISLRFAGEDRCFVMFVNRGISELMMFGAVAITLLLIDEGMARNLGSMNKDQLHWADVFCSVSAVLLIVVGYWAFRVVVKPKEYYERLAKGPTSKHTIDFFVFGGTITRKLTEEFGLTEGGTQFAHYVREVLGQLIAELIDVNLVTWVSFMVPPAISWIVMEFNEIRELDEYGSLNRTEQVRLALTPPPPPDSLTVELLLGIGWLWFGLTVGLDMIAMLGMVQLRKLYGVDDMGAAIAEMNDITNTPVSELRQTLSSMDALGLDATPSEGRAKSASLSHSPTKSPTTPSGVRAKWLTAAAKSAPNLAVAEEHSGWEKLTGSNSNWMQLKLAIKEQEQQEWAAKTEMLQRRLLDGKSLSTGSRGASGMTRSSCSRATSVSTVSMAKTDGARDQMQQMASYDDLPDPKDHIWAARHRDLMKEFLQIIMMFACGQVALYILSLRYGIEASGIGAGWHVFALFPPAAILFVLLPHLCYSIGMFEAYAVPNMPILDNVRRPAPTRPHVRAVARRTHLPCRRPSVNCAWDACAPGPTHAAPASLATRHSRRRSTGH